MNTIVPHLWFDKEAKQAAELYVSLFDNSRIVSSSVINDTPSGDAETVDFELAGLPFAAISGGPFFKFTPSVSLMVACASASEVDALWNVLIQGGKEMMPLDEYPFSPRYGWLEDRYGLGWQLMLTEGDQPAQKITPNLLFSGPAAGKAEEAVRYYTNVFPNAKVDRISHYAEAEVKDKANYIGFELLGKRLSAMDNTYEVDYTFNEAFSLMVLCDTQEQIDYYWDKLSRVPEAEACGWLKDQYGVSWQIVPRALGEMMENGDEQQVRRVTEAFLQMKKFDIKALQNAYQGE